MYLDIYIKALIEREGGFSNHPADKGGPTMYGVTEQVARAFGYYGQMSALPEQTAVTIYKQRYWENPHFDKVNEHSPVIAEELLDTGVNMGVSIASKFLQRALNTLNAEGKHYPDIVVDGAIGQMTIASLRAFLAQRGANGHVVLVRMLNALQGSRYIEIAEAKPNQEAFIYGWFLSRVT